jgi:2,4-dienoyl-CoA reductase-like NADH-dependent reductase (Old Yellow Enzyme family)
MRQIFESVNDEKEAWFEKRTKHHIDLTKKYCRRIHEYDAKHFPNIIKMGEKHDASKYRNPERIPYVDISWHYRMKDLGKKYEVTPEQQKAMDTASANHINTNPHHPEYHSPKHIPIPINANNRDKPVEGKMVDATKMDDENIGEMVADWSAMSEEKGGTPKEWADKTVNKRWKFTPKQVALIYELINAIW